MSSAMSFPTAHRVRSIAHYILIVHVAFSLYCIVGVFRAAPGLAAPIEDIRAKVIVLTIGLVTLAVVAMLGFLRAARHPIMLFFAIMFGYFAVGALGTYAYARFLDWPKIASGTVAITLFALVMRLNRVEQNP